jgi:hypothetical protein
MAMLVLLETKPLARKDGQVAVEQMLVLAPTEASDEQVCSHVTRWMDLPSGWVKVMSKMLVLDTLAPKGLELWHVFTRDKW